MHPMDDPFLETQTSIRLPKALARLLAARARARGVSKSVVVREALERHLMPNDDDTGALVLRERSTPYLGALRLDRSSESGDSVTGLIRARNWRE